MSIHATLGSMTPSTKFGELNQWLSEAGVPFRTTDDDRTTFVHLPGVRPLRVKLTTNIKDLSLRPFLPSPVSMPPCQFHLNDEEMTEADVWIVLDIFESGQSYACKIPAGCLALAQYEVAYTASYFQQFPERLSFLRQFDAIYSPYTYEDLAVVASPPFLPWMLNSNLETWMQEHERDWEYLTNMRCPEKSSLISMIVSDKSITSAQRERLRFAEKAQKYFGSDLEWYGSNIRTIPEKFDAIAPFRFHIALENRIGNHIWTEKLIDPLLGWSFPFYWGAPNVTAYFPENSFCAIDATRPFEALRKIHSAMRADSDKTNRHRVSLARSIALNSMNFVNRLARIAWDVFGARDSNSYTTRRVAGPSIPSHVGYRALNA